MKYDDPRPVWTRLDHHALVDAGGKGYDVRGGWRGAGERDGQDKLQPGEDCQSIGMLSSCVVEEAEARASARVSGCSCLYHLPIKDSK